MYRNKISSSKLVAAIASTIMIVAFLMSLGAVAGTHTADVEVTPKELTGSSRTTFDITVTNTSGSPDNIKAVTISTSAFAEPISGAAQGENIENAGDNLSTAASHLSSAAADMEDAGGYQVDAGSMLYNMGGHLYDAAEALPPKNEDARLPLKTASSDIEAAGENLQGVSDIITVSSNLGEASGYISDAADNLIDIANPDNVKNKLENTASYLENAAENLKAGCFENIAGNLKGAADNMENAAISMKNDDSTAAQNAGADMKKAAADLMDAALDFEALDNELELVGNHFGDLSENASGALFDAGLFLENVTELENAGYRLENAGENLKSCAGLLSGGPTENVFTARVSLFRAGKEENWAGAILMKALGGDDLQTAGGAMIYAGENMKKPYFNLPNAAGLLSAASTALDSSGSKLTDAGSSLQAHEQGEWNFTPSSMKWTANDPSGGPLTGDNTLAPEESVTFSIILRPVKDGDVDFNILTTDTASPSSTDAAPFTISIDNTKPSISDVRVYQEGVGQDNIVGDEYDNGMATVEITASEELSSLKNVKLSVDGENLMDLSMSSDDNVTYTREFEVKEWDENDCAIYVGSLTDSNGLENDVSDNLDYNFYVDTRAPQFGSPTTVTPPANPANPVNGDNSGLTPARKDQSIEITDRAQSPENVWATDNDAWTVNGEIMDNQTTNNPSGVTYVKGLVNGEVVEIATVMSGDNWFSADDLNLGSDGVKDITIWATDKTGNVVENTLENVFLDTTQPTISGYTPENQAIINDNKATVSVQVSDAGLGIDNATLRVTDANGKWLDNADNFQASVTLENDSQTWSETKHWIWVYARDGLNDNVTENWWFKVDVTEPDGDVAQGTVFREPDGSYLTTGAVASTGRTDKSTLTLYGSVDQDGSTIIIWEKGSWTEVDSFQEDPTDDDVDWTTTITLDEGSHQLYIQEEDRAGNKSDKVHLSKITVDQTPPVITLSDETKSLDQTSTGKSSVKISATIEDAVVDSSDLGVSIRADAYDRPETPVSISGKTLEISVPLVEGSNTIDILAGDGFNTSKASITVKRTAKSWPMIAAIAAIVAIILAAIAVLRRQTA